MTHWRHIALVLKYSASYAAMLLCVQCVEAPMWEVAQQLVGVCKKDNVYNRYNSVFISLFILWLNLVCFIKITETLALGTKFALQRMG